MVAVETQDYSTRNTETLDCRMLPIEQLGSGANPRHNLDLEGERFAELVRSIQERGIRQPLLVRPSACLEPGPPFEIVAGERRYRAALALHLIEVPVRVVVQDDEASLLDALIENLMREDIDPIDEARGYKSLMDLGLKQTEIAVKVGRSQPAIANTLRLLKLPEPVQDDISAGRMTQSHGEALLAFAQYPEVLEVQREAALGGQTCKAVAEPDYWKLCREGKIRALVSEWPECKNCNHKRKGYDRYCLKLECFDEKKAAADAKLLEKAKKSAGVDDASKLLKLADMKHEDYERLDVSILPGCSKDCEKRVVALDHELRPVAVCLDPSHHRKLKLAESKAVHKTQRETAAGVTIQTQELLYGHNMQGPTPFKQVLDRAAALLTLRVIQGVHKGAVKSVMERMKAKGLDLDVEFFKPSQVCAPPDAEELTKLEQLGYLNLLLFGAELALAESVEQSLDYGGNHWKVPEKAKWFLRDIGHMDPEEIGEQMQVAADEEPAREADILQQETTTHPQYLNAEGRRYGVAELEWEEWGVVWFPEGEEPEQVIGVPMIEFETPVTQIQAQAMLDAWAKEANLTPVAPLGFTPVYGDVYSDEPQNLQVFCQRELGDDAHPAFSVFAAPTEVTEDGYVVIGPWKPIDGFENHPTRTEAEAELIAWAQVAGIVQASVYYATVDDPCDCPAVNGSATADENPVREALIAEVMQRDGCDRSAAIEAVELMMEALQSPDLQLAVADPEGEASLVDKDPDYVWLGTKGDESRFVDHVRQAGSLIIISDRETGAEFSAEKSELKRYGGHGFTLAEEDQQEVEDASFDEPNEHGVFADCEEVIIPFPPSLKTRASIHLARAADGWRSTTDYTKEGGDYTGFGALPHKDDPAYPTRTAALISGLDELLHHRVSVKEKVKPHIRKFRDSIVVPKPEAVDEPEEVKPVNYLDAAGNAYSVGQGIGSGPWMTFKLQPGTTQHARSSHRVKSKFLPDQPTSELAQLDLNAYAEKHGLTAEEPNGN